MLARNGPGTSPAGADVAFGDAGTAGRIAVAVVLPAGAAPDAGAARLLETLACDARFALAARIEGPRTPSAPPPLVAGLLALEARVAARPPHVPTPSFDALDLPALTVEDALRDMPEVDVVLDLAPAEGAEALARRARHGLWRLSTAADTAGVADALRGAPESRVRLCRLTAPGAAWETLADAAYDTKFLAARNRMFQREKAAQLAEHALARLAEGLLAPAPSADASPEPASATALPGYLARTAGEVGRRLSDKLAERRGRRPGRFCLRLTRGSILEFDHRQGQELDAPAGRYWADPFLFEDGGTTWLFYEEYVYATGLGHIAVGRLDGDGFTPLGPALDTGTHLSFPFVFRHGGDIFMVPETGATHRLEVWRATDFPTGWTLHATALEGTACADTVFHPDGDGYWLFTNICRDSLGDFCSELHLFRADGPDLKTVTPHPLNPVVVGSRNARGAGRITALNGRLYRPSQDNSHGTYGHGLNIMEIETLSATDYRERRVRHLAGPEAPGLIGCHHVDVAGDRVVYDIRRP
ncbi:hypothetical protein P1J78_13175 [Psychromarinibacter sp. C21-152]|uniref:Glucosamine inositolphosphorylceramide transferase 1 N-terminal domain-containing protein n=1 Tax=Psychromarinibacter sediminicola TaxID=3033385 RepID=A0AAE3TAJ5_9RHOB|nr:hypothetical protein [Psychromarinibacter sediminicola]MDF0601690.1 hypothetical protein [Psychromarinibacter sediminicola]